MEKKRVSSVNGAEEIEYSHVKDETRPLSYTTHRS